MRHGHVLHFYGAGRFSHGMKELLFAMLILHHKNKMCSPHHCKASRCSHSWKGSFQDATFCHSFTHIPAGVGIGWAHPRKKFTFVSLYALCFKCTLRNTMHCSNLSKEMATFWVLAHSPRACQCHEYISRHDRNFPLCEPSNIARCGGNEWTPWLLPFDGDSGLALRTFDWSVRLHYRKHSHTLMLKREIMSKIFLLWTVSLLAC